MTSRANATDFLTAIITHGAAEPTESVERLGDDAVFSLIAAASLIAVGREFGDSTSSAEIQEYATGLKNRFAEHESEVKPIIVEAVIRAALGEGQLLEGLDRNDIVSTMFLLTYAIMSHQQLSAEEQQVFVNEVLDMSGIG